MSRVNNPPDAGNFVISVAKSQIEASTGKRLSAGINRTATRSSDMDPDYREYFRPRGGEFLTRGAALASAQLLASDYATVAVAGTPVGSARGSLASHLDTIGANGNGGAGVASVVPSRASQAGPAGINTVSISRLQAAAAKEKYGERRNPTILRKSK